MCVENAMMPDIEHEMDIQKWLMSEKANKDLGDAAKKKWADENLSIYIRTWHEMNDCDG